MFPTPRLLPCLLAAVLAGAPFGAGASRLLARAKTPLEAGHELRAAFAAALLRESNRVRREHDLPPLRTRNELNLAADDQAAFMALTLSTQHHSVIRGQEWPADRVQRRGLDDGRVAENVATITVAPSGAEEPRNVEEIVAQLVEGWMSSPGHRANLLNRDYTMFGGSVRLARLVGGAWGAFGVQVFYTPPARSAPI